MDRIMLAFLDWSQIGGFAMIFAGLGIVIFFHELGHFLAARWAGIRVQVFSLGFGPRLFGIKRGDTDYRVSLIPLGGYVSMLGQEDVGEIKEIKDEDAFCNRSVGKRSVVISAGVVMNIVFAMIVFVIVFLVGKEQQIAQVGRIQAHSPAARAGLRPGDRIVRVNDEQINSFMELTQAIVFSDGEIELEVERNGEGRITIPAFSPEKDVVLGMRTIGIEGDNSNKVANIAPPLIVAEDAQSRDGREPLLRKNDVILTVNRWPVYAMEALDELAEESNKTKTLSLVVLRNGELVTAELPVPEAKDGKRNWEFSVVKETDSNKWIKIIKGFERIVRPGDRIVSLDGHGVRESLSEIAMQIGPRYGEVLPATVERDGETVKVFVAMASGAKPTTVALGISPALRVGGVSKGKTAEAQGLRKGDIIRRIGDVHWPSLSQLQRQCSLSRDGKLSIEFERGGKTENRVLKPRLDPEFGQVVIGVVPALPKNVRVGQVISGSVADKAKITPGCTIERVNGQPVANWVAFMRLLSRRVRGEIDRPLKIEGTADGKPFATTLDVTEASEIPVATVTEGIVMPPLTAIRRTGNPIEAIAWGFQETVCWIKQVFMSIGGMISGKVGAGGAAGPVRIIGYGAQIAEHGGVTKLLWFLGMLSTNLAVINFLPFPVLDGGHMVFLTYEKIRGKPAPAKLQFALQLIGLAMILLLFVSLTINDIRNMFTG